MKEKPCLLLVAMLVALAGGCAGHNGATSCVTPATAAVASACKSALKVVRVDSEETGGENGRGANAVDGDPNTLWHTQWQDASPECPHEIVIELTPPAPIQGFTYLPRQDESDHGEVKGYEFLVVV